MILAIILNALAVIFTAVSICWIRKHYVKTSEPVFYKRVIFRPNSSNVRHKQSKKIKKLSKQLIMN